MRIEAQSLVTMGRSFLNIVDHACTIEQLHPKAYKHNSIWARHEGSYCETYYKVKECHDGSK